MMLKNVKRFIVSLIIGCGIIPAVGYATTAELDVSVGEVFTKADGGQLHALKTQRRFAKNAHINTAENAKARLLTNSGYFLSLGPRTSIVLTDFGLKLVSGSLQVQKLKKDQQPLVVRFNQFQAEFKGDASQSIMFNSASLSSACLVSGEVDITQNRAPLATLGDADYCVIYDQSKPELPPIRLLTPTQRNRLLTETTLSPAPASTLENATVNQPAPEAIQPPAIVEPPKTTAQATREPKAASTSPAEITSSLPARKPPALTTPPAKPPTPTQSRQANHSAPNDPIGKPVKPSITVTPNQTSPVIEPQRATRTNIPPNPVAVAPTPSQPALQPIPNTTQAKPIRSVPKPATKAPATIPRTNRSTPTTKWNLYLRSTPDKTRARDFALKLRKSGYKTVLLPYNNNGTPYYRVAIIGFTSKQSAKRTRARIKQRYGVRDAWIGNQSEYE